VQHFAITALSLWLASHLFKGLTSSGLSIEQLSTARSGWYCAAGWSGIRTLATILPGWRF